MHAMHYNLLKRHSFCWTLHAKWYPSARINEENPREEVRWRSRSKQNSRCTSTSCWHWKACMIICWKGIAFAGRCTKSGTPKMWWTDGWMYVPTKWNKFFHCLKWPLATCWGAIFMDWSYTVQRSIQIVKGFCCTTTTLISTLEMTTAKWPTFALFPIQNALYQKQLCNLLIKRHHYLAKNHIYLYSWLRVHWANTYVYIWDNLRARH